MGGLVLLSVGTFVSTYAVNFPVKENPSTFMEKLFGGKPSDFETSETFIYKLFHFNHTCSMLDFNPSKTIAALIIMLHTLPMLLFVICHYLRITSQTDSKYDTLKMVTKVFSPIQFVVFTYFYMVFVNSPDGEFGTASGMRKFALHYVPYGLWQLGMLLMAIQQCWFLSLKDQLPFPWITHTMLRAYLYFMGALFTVYTYFIVSFMLGSPAWDTTTTIGLLSAKGIMYIWDVVAAIIPMIMAWYESTDGNDTQFTFEELQ